MKRRSTGIILATALILGAGVASAAPPLQSASPSPHDAPLRLAANERANEREHRAREKAAAQQQRRTEAEPAAGPPGNAFTVECEWIGKRVVNLLLRDDAMAANDFMPFYEGFDCDREHLSRAFGCAVVNDSVTEGEARIQRVNACWRDPSIRLPLAEKTAPANPAAGKPVPGDKPANGPLEKPAEPIAPKPSAPPSLPTTPQKGG